MSEAAERQWYTKLHCMTGRQAIPRKATDLRGEERINGRETKQ